MAEVADLWVKLSLLSTGFSEGLAKSGAEAEGFSAKISKVGDGLGKMAKAGAAAGAGMVVVSATMAANWQQSMIKLMTSAGETGSVVNGKLTGPISQVSDGLLKMAVATGTSTKQLASGMYFVESAGFHGAAGLQVMKAAAEGAKAEGADLSTVTDALTTALHDMGMGATQSIPMMNMMVRAVGDGKMTMEAFAGSLHSVLPQAHAAGIAFPDVAAAIATMTVAGTSADQATQMLGHTIQSLQNPNAQAVKWMSQMGLSATDLKENLGNRGLLGTITMVDQAILQHMGPDGTILQSAFNKSQSAAQDLSVMLGQMPSKLRQWSQEVENGSMSAKDYTAAIKTLPANLYAQGQQFLTGYKNANSFNQALRSGTPDVDTFAGMLRKVLGDSVDANTALQIGGQNLAYYAQTAKDVADAGQNAGANIETWSTIQQGFNFRMSQAKEAIETTAIRAGTMLLPKLTDLFDLMTSRGGPILHQLEQDVRNALDSPAVHQAEAVISQFWHDFVGFMGDATRSTENLWHAVEPLAGQLAVGLFGGLKLVGGFLKNDLGPALLAVTGFFRDHSAVVKDLADVALAALIAKLLYTKTLLAIDMFTTFAKGISSAITGILDFGKAVASGQVFDTLRLKAMYAADAVKGVGAAATGAGEEAAAASGAAGIGRFSGVVSNLVTGGLLIGGAVAGIGLLASAFSHTGGDAAAAAASVDQFTTAMLNSKKDTTDASMAFGHAADDLNVLSEALAGKLAVNTKFEGQDVADLKRSFDFLAESSVASVEPMARLGVELGKVNQVSGAASNSLKAYDGGLANLVSNGQIDRAKQLMAEIAQVTDNHGKALINTARDFPQYFAALDSLQSSQALGISTTQNSTTALNANTTALGDNSTALGGTSSSLDSTATATDALANSTDALMQQQQDMSKGLNADRALDDYNRAVSNLTKSLNDNGTSFKGTSDAAMNNRDALRGAVQSIIDNYNAQVQLDGGTKDATQKLHEQVNELENQKGMSQQTKDAIKAYIDQLNLIPTNVTTTVVANTSAATAQVRDLQNKLNNLASRDGNSTSSSPAPPKGGGHNLPTYGLGGYVNAPKGQPQLAVVHGGEFILSNDMLDNSGGTGGGFNTAGGAVNYYTTVNVQGSILAEQDIRNLVETQMLQNGGRRPQTYAPYQR